MAGAKVEYPPLLADGFHALALAELRELCVTNKACAKSKTRADLLGRLANVVAKLESAAIIGELWVDGSFLTEKPDPDDIDLSLRIQADVYNNGTPEQQAVMDWIETIYDTEKIDGYLQIEFPIGDPNYLLGIDS